MNAEIFEKKEYADSVARVDFIRVYQLEKDMKFMMNGIWFIVHSKTKERLFYYNSGGRRSKSESMGAKSQMFVQVAK